MIAGFICAHALVSDAAWSLALPGHEGLESGTLGAPGVHLLSSDGWMDKCVHGEFTGYFPRLSPPPNRSGPVILTPIWIGW